MPHLSDEQIAKYLSGNCTAEEEKNILLQITGDPENEKLYTDSRGAWNTAKKAPEITFDSEKGWKEVMSHFGTVKKAKSKVNIWLKIAAVITGVIFINYICLTSFVKEYKDTYSPVASVKPEATQTLIVPEPLFTEISTSDSIKIFLLPDNSKITLNKNSSLWYLTNFSERKVELIGEAFFEVTHNEASPFYVQAKDVSVKVLGTTFNVNTNKKEHAEVTVISGKVKVSGINNRNEITLTEGEKGVYVFQKESLKKENVAKHEYWWKKIKLVKKIDNFFKNIKKRKSEE